MDSENNTSYESTLPKPVVYGAGGGIDDFSTQSNQPIENDERRSSGYEQNIYSTGEIFGQNNINTKTDIPQNDPPEPTIPLINNTVPISPQIYSGNVVREWVCQIDPSHSNIRASKKCRNCNLMMCLACSEEYTDNHSISICFKCKDELENENNNQIQNTEKGGFHDIPIVSSEQVSGYNENERLNLIEQRDKEIKKHISTQTQLCFLFVFFVILSFFIVIPVFILPFVSFSMLVSSMVFCATYNDKSIAQNEENRKSVHSAILWDIFCLALQCGYFVVILTVIASAIVLFLLFGAIPFIGLFV